MASPSPEPAPPERARAPRAGLVLAVVLLIVAGVYAPVLEGGFVWDDQMIVAQAARVREFRGLSDYFGRSFWADYAPSERQGDFYRPIVTLSFAFDAWVHRGNPAGFHLTNLLAHLAVVGLLFARLRGFGARAVTSGLLSLLFGIAPRLSESVAWVSGRTDILALLFSMLALQLGVPPPPGRPTAAWREALLAAAVAAALFSKESAVVVLIALGIHACSLPTRRARLVRWGLLAACAVAYGVLRYQALAHLDPAPSPPQTAIGRAMVVLEAVARYAFMAAWPFQPQTQIGLAMAPQVGWAIAGGFIVLCSAALAWRHRRQLRALASAPRVHLLLAALPLLLVIQLRPLPMRIVAADRFLYAPLLGLLLFVGPALDRWLKGNTRRQWLACGGLAAVSVASAPVTRSRAMLWGDDIAFWDDAVRTTPRANPLPRSQLGNVYFEAAMFDEARRTYLTIEPTFTSRRNTATVLRRLGQCEASSLLWARIFDQGGKTLPSDFVGAARSAMCLGRLDQARAIAERGLAAHPGHEAIVQVLGDLDYVAAHGSEGPGHGSAAELARATDVLIRAGRDPDAVAAWTAVASAPDATAAELERAALFLLRLGPLPAATAAIERATRQQTPSALSLQLLLAERRARAERLLALVPLATSMP